MLRAFINPGIPAVLAPEGELLRDKPLERGNSLGKFIGSGTFGVVFEIGDGSMIIKIEATPRDPQRIPFVMSLNNWASKNRVGPGFDSWGTLQLPPESFVVMRSMLGKESPKWLKNPVEGQTYIYSIFEKWNSSLFDYLASTSLQNLRYIPIAVILAFKEKIKQLHSLQVVHIDLTLDNILVTVKDGIITNMVLSDFGSAMPRKRWFFTSTEQFRQDNVKRYRNFDWLEPVIETVDQKRSGGFDQWITQEPFNLDWCVLLLCSYYTNIPSIWADFHSPPYFNFAIPWSPEGWLEVTVINGTSSLQTKIYGLMSAADLRQILGEPVRKSLFQTTNGQMIPTNREANVFVSSLLRPSPLGYQIKLMNLG